MHTPGTEARLAKAYLYVPADYRKETSASLALLLHGTGEDAHDGLAQLRGRRTRRSFPARSRLSRSHVGSDPEPGTLRSGRSHIDRALGYTFSHCAVDPERVGVGGYSDGAFYALALANGDLFSHVLVFSPGFLAPTGQAASPRIFVSHRTRDEWLPIYYCSRRIVPGSNAPDTRYATANSRAATWDREMSRGKRQAGSPTEAKDAPAGRPRATEVPEGMKSLRTAWPRRARFDPRPTGASHKSAPATYSKRRATHAPLPCQPIRGHTGASASASTV